MCSFIVIRVRYSCGWRVLGKDAGGDGCGVWRGNSGRAGAWQFKKGEEGLVAMAVVVVVVMVAVAVVVVVMAVHCLCLSSPHNTPVHSDPNILLSNDVLSFL